MPANRNSTSMPINAATGRRARGVSLVETLVAVSIGTVILVLVVATIGRVGRHERRLRSDFERAAIWQRFAVQFRADIHAAQQAEPSTPAKVSTDAPVPADSNGANADAAEPKPSAESSTAATSLRLTRPDGLLVIYRPVEEGLERLESTVADAPPRRRESYLVGHGWQSAFASQREGPVTIVSVDWQQMDPRTVALPRWRLEAVLDADRPSRAAPRRRRVRSAARRSRGMMLAAALAALLVVALMAAALTHRLTLGHRQSRLAQRQAQAAVLAESGARRAASALRRSADYVGETWSPPAERFGPTATAGGHVTIAVESDRAMPRRRLVTVSARFPDDPIHGITQQRQFTLEIPPAGDAP